MKRSHRIAPAVLLVGFALASTAPASAKELTALEVCGAAGCTRITHRSVLRELIRAIEAHGHPVSVSTPSPAPFLRLDYYLRGHRNGRPDFPPVGSFPLAAVAGAMGAAALAVPAAWLVRRRRRR